jgi:hypothetical protein
MRGFFMTKPVKIIVSVVGGGLLLVVVALVVTLIMIDSVAKTGIEKGGSYALGVPTALDSASIGIASGKFGLSGLAVDNPQGFEGKFLKLGDGGVEVSLGSLMKDTVVLPRLALSDVELDLKRTSSGSNYGIILDNLKKLESGEKAKPKEEKPGKTFKIGEVVISNVVVHLDLVGGPSGLTSVNIPIHEVRLTNVGSDGSGVDIAELTSILLQAIIAAAVDKGGSLIPADIAGDLKGGLQQLSGLADVGVEAVGKVGEQVSKLGLGEAASGAVKDATDTLKGLGGLLDSKKEKK